MAQPLLAIHAGTARHDSIHHPANDRLTLLPFRPALRR
jgi:hypothetical protein